MKSFIFTGVFTISVFCCWSAFSQDYLITTKGDTIKGEVKPFTAGAEKSVRVITADKNKRKYPLLQIRAYSFKGETYHPVRNQSGYTFMKVIKPGYLTLYAFQMDNQTSYDGLLLKKGDGNWLEVPNLNFKKAIKKFLEDCPTVVDSIEQRWGRKDLDKMVDGYNKCIDDRTQATHIDNTKKDKQLDKVSAWTTFEEKVNASQDFEGKADAIEMIADVKGKLSRGEKIPKFLLDGLKSAFEPTPLKEDLHAALAAIEQ